MYAAGPWPHEMTPIVLLGPTAMGKTEVAVELAERCGGEIVNADSMQVYIGMDIGTAKPSLAEQRRVPFHLLDMVRPDQSFSVSEWKVAAENAIAAITSRDHRAIICGGTGLYIRALVDDWSLAATPADPDIRRELKAEADSTGPAALHARLMTLDPETAARLHPNDTVRVIRALEVRLVTGVPLSAYLAQDRRERAARPVVQIGLTMPRPDIYARIDARVDRMMAQGMEREVRALLEQGYSYDLAPFRSLGYKEMCAYLRGEMDRQTAIDTIKLNTRRFSKRQQTWFRADPRIQWIDVSALSSATVAEHVHELITIPSSASNEIVSSDGLAGRHDRFPSCETA